MYLHARLESALHDAQRAPVEAASTLARRGVQCMDLTSLESTDTPAQIEALANLGRTHGVAAICVFPTFIETIQPLLAGSSVQSACVAMAFPHGQAPLAVRKLEVELAVAAGAQEIDVVIRRGLVLSEQWSLLVEELQVAREASKGATLKVILETGELKEPALIYRAARLALEHGADFVKTSTGKSAVGATPEAAAALLLAIQDDGQQRGLKVSGGVRSLADFQTYHQLVATTLGTDALTPARFRVGASSLLASLTQILDAPQHS